MDNESKKKKVWIREILVAIDTSKHSHAALQAAVSLARTMEANIQGIFVHDEVWSHISQLPFASAVNTLTGQIFSFEDETMDKHVRLLENRLRKKLENLTRHRDITYSWHSARGKVEEEILDAAKEADLITIGLKGSSTRRKIMGSSARQVIEETDKPVLVLKKGLLLGRAITAVYDGSKRSQRGIEIALDIAERNESTLKVLIINNDPEAQGDRNQKLENLFQNRNVFADFELLDRSDASQFLNSVNQHKSGLLIVPKDQPLLERSLQVILNHINCPLLMMN